MEAALEGDEDEEQRLIEERRKRRQQILTKHQQDRELSGALSLPSCIGPNSRVTFSAVLGGCKRCQDLPAKHQQDRDFQSDVSEPVVSFWRHLTSANAINIHRAARIGIKYCHTLEMRLWQLGRLRLDLLKALIGSHASQHVWVEVQGMKSKLSRCREGCSTHRQRAAKQWLYGHPWPDAWRDVWGVPVGALSRREGQPQGQPCPQQRHSLSCSPYKGRAVKTAVCKSPGGMLPLLCIHVSSNKFQIHGGGRYCFCPSC